MEESRIPVVIDADALNAIYQEGVEHSSDAPWVMTPHLGEAGRLLGMTPEVFAQDLLANTKKLVERYRAVVLIKGTYTLIMNTDGRIYINTTGNPVLSVMGTGDILSGIIGALIARGIEPFSAAASGAFIHGLMGDLAAGDLQPEGIPPSRLIPYIPSAMEQIRQGMVESRIRIIS